MTLLDTLRRAWGKVSRTPRLPHESPTSGEAVAKPLYNATVRWSAPSDIMSWKPSPDTGSAPIPPAPAPSSWAAYDALMASHQSYAGWTFCRFGVRGPRSQDHSEVQGIVRAPFGAWWAPFLCVDPGTGHQTSRGLACVEHTRSGMAVGVFGDMDLAVQAAEIAMRMDEWHSFSIDEPRSIDLIYRVRAAWSAAGIVHSSFTGYPTVHGKVPEGQPPIMIFVKNPLADHHRPEKLS